MQGLIKLLFLFYTISVIECSYGEYVFFHLSTTQNQTFGIRNAKCCSGRFCKYEKQDDEIFPSYIQTLTFNDKHGAKFGATGRKNSAVGVEGEFEIITSEGKLVSYVRFNCPWTGTNSLEVAQAIESAGKYICTVLDKIPTSGPLSYTDIQCFHIQ